MEQVGYFEVVLQFQVGLVVEWVVYGVGYGFCLGLEFFLVWCIIGDKVFIYVEGLYGLLFVVVFVQLNFGDIGKLCIFGDGIWWQVVMVVDDGLYFGVVVEQCIGDLIFQQEIFVQKRFDLLLCNGG